MIDACRFPGKGTVAGFTAVGAENMSRIFAGGIDTIVAAKTATGDGTVIKRGRHPAEIGMADLAGLAGGNMAGWFAIGNDVVVATCAGTQYLAVIDSWHIHPRRVAVTIATGIGGRDVMRWFGRGVD